MREQYSGPGQYEYLTPFQAFIADHIDQLADEASGDVEAPTGWFAMVECPNVRPDRRRSFLVSTNDRGFWSVVEFSDLWGAGVVFDQMDKEYGEWLGQDDDGAPTCRHCDRPVLADDHCSVHIGDLCAEVNYAESFADDE